MKNEIDYLREKLCRESMECGYNSSLFGYVDLESESEDSIIRQYAYALDIASMEELQNEYNQMQLYKMKKEEEIRTKKNLNNQKRKIAFMESSKESSVIEPHVFMERCKNLISSIREKSVNYINCTVPVYCPSNYIHIVILFRNNEVFKFGETLNLTQWITGQKKYIDTKDVLSYSLGYTSLRNDDLIKDIIVAINLITNLNRATIPDDSKVFIDKKKLYNYMDIVHGLSASMVKRFFKNNPNITTYVNFGNIVYLKQEIDNKIISDAKRGLFKK